MYITKVRSCRKSNFHIVQAETESKDKNAIDFKEVQSGRHRPNITIDEVTTSAVAGLSIRSVSLEKVLAHWEEDVVDLRKLSCSSFWRLLKSVGFSSKKKN